MKGGENKQKVWLGAFLSEETQPYLLRADQIRGMSGYRSTTTLSTVQSRETCGLT